MGLKTGCVIQGNIRRGTDEVIREIVRHFDHVVLSTWKDEEKLVPAGDFELVLNDKPEAPGYSHRNYQRKATHAGIMRAEALGCTHVLKWRTDFLPTRLNVADLLACSMHAVPAEVPSRMVTCAFRNLSVEPDWYSSIPDLFAFGHVDMMKLLWGSEDIDYSLKMNPPGKMLAECGPELLESRQGDVFCAESELYAHFRARLELLTGRRLSHPVIAREFMYLIDHERLGICWFAAAEGFRPVIAGRGMPWWTERTWRTGKPAIVAPGYPVPRWWQLVGRPIEKLLGKLDVSRQVLRYRRFRHDQSGATEGRQSR